MSDKHEGENNGQAVTPDEQEVTIDALAQCYLGEYARAKKNPSIAARDEQLLEQFILPALGSREVYTITSTDVAQLYIEAGQESTVHANRCLAVFSKMMTLAVWREVYPGESPCRGHFRARFKHGLLRMQAGLESMGLDRSELDIDEETWNALGDRLRNAIGYYIFRREEQEKSSGRGRVNAKLRRLIRANSEIKKLSVRFDPATKRILHRIGGTNLQKVEQAFKVLEEELPIVAVEAEECLERAGKSGNFPNIAEKQLIRDLAKIYEEATGKKATLIYDQNFARHQGAFLDAVAIFFEAMGIKRDRKALGSKIAEVIYRDKSKANP